MMKHLVSLLLLVLLYNCPGAGTHRWGKKRREVSSAGGWRAGVSFAELKRLWYSDLYRYDGKANLRLLMRILLLGWGPPGFRYTLFLRLCTALRAARPRLIAAPCYLVARLLLRHYQYRFGIEISPLTRIGYGLHIGHFSGIVVHGDVSIGNNCSLYQGVTLGRTYRGSREGCPRIGDNVYISPGAKVIGAICVGSNVLIGANCVVSSDIPDNAVVVGVPGRVISYAGTGGYVVNVVGADGALPDKPEDNDSGTAVGNQSG